MAFSFGLGYAPFSAWAQEPVSPSDPSVSPLLVQSGTSVLDASSIQSSTGLTVSPGATAVIDFGSASQMTFSGDILNSGSIYAFSSNPAVTTASFAAANIFNNQGSILSTVLPANLTGFTTNAVSNLNLSLTALNQIVNMGTISSAGNLSLTAGNSIVNQSVISAAQNLNIASVLGSVTNSGIMSAAAGNLNISSLVNSNLLVNNLGGRMEALLGTISMSVETFLPGS